MTVYRNNYHVFMFMLTMIVLGIPLLFGCIINGFFFIKKQQIYNIIILINIIYSKYYLIFNHYLIKQNKIQVHYSKRFFNRLVFIES
jgi:hypothetical protein